MLNIPAGRRLMPKRPAFIRELPLHIVGNARHGFHGLNRILPHRAFFRKHDRVRPVQDGIGHIIHFCARGPRTAHHRLQHLGGRDYGFAGQVGPGNNILLCERNPFKRQFNAQIAPRHHDGIDFIQNGIQIRESLGLFNLGDDRRIAAVPEDNFPDQTNIIRRTHKRKRNIIHAVVQSELQIRAILIRKNGDACTPRRQIDALARIQRPARDHPTLDVLSRDFFHGQLQHAVRQQQAVSGLHKARHLPVIHGNLILIARHIPRGQNKTAPRRQRNRPIRNRANTNFGSGNVLEYGDGFLQACGHRPDDADHLSMFLVGAVRKIQARHVHAGPNQFFNHGLRVGCRAYGAYNFGPLHVVPPAY